MDVQQRWMNLLATHGSALLDVVIGNSPNYDRDDDDDDEDLMMLHFIKWKINEVLKTPLSNISLKPDSLLPMPPEMYRGRLTKLRRRRLFFKNLKRRDILYLQVINIKNKESYKCLALAKHDCLMWVEDLSIVIHFPKLRSELEFISGDLHKFDLIRAAFWSCSVWERKLFVTMDDSIFDENEKEKIPKLGRIARNDLPYYVLMESKIGMTYAGYVQQSEEYNTENNCTKQLSECLGIDVDRFYSFYDYLDAKTYPPSESFAEIRKNLHPDPSTRRLHKSYNYFKIGNMYKALHYANKAIAFNPDNIQARVTRGTVYANLGKMKKALIDTKDSLKLDSNHESARKQMSELLISASKK